MTGAIVYTFCPHCASTHPARVTRTCPAATEWKCLSCGWTWNVRPGEPDIYYVFYPPDIEAALDNDIKPLDFGIP